jgi:hypothetical protein
MKASRPLLASQFRRGLRDNIRLGLAPALLNVMQKKDSTIDELASELKALALLLPDRVVGPSSSGRANPTQGHYPYQHKETSPPPYQAELQLLQEGGAHRPQLQEETARCSKARR